MVTHQPAEPLVHAIPTAGTRVPAAGSGRIAATPQTVWVMSLTALLLMGAELAVRGRAWVRHGTSSPVADIYEEDALLGRRLRPSAILSGSRRALSINRWGFRGPDVPLEKPSGTIRIAAIGESTTFGLEATNDASVWVARLTDQLSRDCPSHRFDFINAAVPGYSTTQCARVLRDKVAAFQPDIVTILVATSDIAAQSRRQFGRRAGATDRAAWPARLLADESLLFSLLRANTAGLRSGWAPLHRGRRLEQRGVDEFVRHLDEMIRFALSRGIRVVLCTYPRAFGDPTAPTAQTTLGQSALANNPSLLLDGLNDAYDRYNAAIRLVAERHGVWLVDLDQMIPRRRVYFHDSVHLSDAGHKLAAQSIARILKPFLAGRDLSKGGL